MADGRTDEDPRLAFLQGGGRCGELIRSIEWGATPLGPAREWPSSLKTAVSLMLSSPQPAYIAWGSDLLSLYNDGFLPIVGDKHPGIGLPHDQLWPEVLDEFRPALDALLGGEPQQFTDHPVRLAGRPGVPIGWFSFSWTPLRNDSGEVVGFYSASIETTERVLADQRRAALQRLESRVRDVESLPDLVFGSSEILAEALGACRVGYGTVDPDQGTIVVERNWNAPGFADVAGLHHFTDYGSYIEQLCRGEPVAVSNVETDPRTAHRSRAFQALGIAAHLDVPVMENGRTTAEVFVHSPVPRIWSDEEILFVREVAQRTRAVVARREAEASARRADDRVRSMADAAPVLIWETDEDGVVFVNQHYLDFFGEPLEGVRGMGWTRFMHPDDAEVYGGAYRDARAGRRAFVQECRFRRADGAWRWLRSSGGPALDGRFVGCSIDITEMREAREALKASEARFRLLTETIDEVFYLADLDAGKVIYVSPAYERLWHRPPDDLYSDITAYARPIHPDDLPLSQQAFARQAEGKPTEVEYRIVRPDGEVCWILDRSFPARERGRRLAAGVAEDITARRVAEQELRDLTDTLDERVQQRTAELELAQEALRQSQKLEAMGQLTGGVAHDFNNLLSPIIGGLDLLQRRGVGDERSKRLIDGALASAERAKTLVQRLLAFARRQPLQPSAVDLLKLIREMADLIDSTTGPQVRVAVHAPEALPPACADANQIEMALLNLAVNARDAMPDGGTLTIAASPVEVDGQHRSRLAPGQYLSLSVTDTGTGMDAATVRRAVEPFFSTKGVGKGTGLGLSMVHGLAAQLGGALHIDSSPGVGTRIELILPIAEPEAPVEARARAEADGRSSGTALLVDDEEIVRSNTAEMLRDLGYSVVEAESGEQALSLLQDGTTPDLVITDHLMPGMTGTELVQAAQDALRGVPVILASGYAEIEGVAPQLPRLAKPFRRDELAAVIAAVAPSVSRS